MTYWAILGHFFHGLTFFTLGLIIVFLQYRSQRILLARRLSWLGGFVLCEALAAWNDLLIQLTMESASLLPLLQPIFLATGYAFLLAFGIQTFLPGEDSVHIERIPIWLNLLWAVPFGVVLLLAPDDPALLAANTQVIVRYAFALPGGLLTAIGLRRQSYQTLQPKIRERIRPYLRLIEVMTGAFGVLSIILVPPVSSFLPSALKIAIFDFSTAEWLRSAVGLGLTLGLVRALTIVQMDVEQWIEGVERLQALAVERERIGRELHDGIIQSIYASGLLLESVLPAIASDPVRAQAQLGRVMDSLNETIQDIRRYIFDLRSDMPDDDLRSGIERLLRDFRINTLLETELQITGVPVEILSMERRRHIFQIIREALTNTARHAKAQWVKIQLDYGESALDITISDDGIGMETLLVSKGYGLRNIRERARMLDGTLRIESAPAEGVTFYLTVPY